MSISSSVILAELAIRPMSAGNLARRLMGQGVLPKTSESYAEVKAALLEQLAAGRVKKAGNGKTHHWRVA